MLSDIIGLDASRLATPRRLALGFAVLALGPVLLVVEWMLAAPMRP